MGVFARLGAASLCASLLVPTGAVEARDAQFEALMEALKIADTIAIMQAEGRVYGADIASDMLPDTEPDAWIAEVARIYDADKMFDVIADNMEAALEGADLAPILGFYDSETGQEIVALELSARRAFLDPEFEALAKDRLDAMAAEGARLMEQIETLIDDSDLVESNVAGALNSDLMFYRGLVDGGAYEMTEDEILAEAWAREEELRSTSRDWLAPFLMVAYQPLDPQVLDDYAAFWRTPEGRALNRALFVGFDRMYEDISYLLGLAVAAEMASEKL